MNWPFKKDTLVVGPYVGEFGWELMAWQGYVRKLRQYYKRTIVISYENSKYLYEGCDFYGHTLQLKNSGFAYGAVADDIRTDLLEACCRHFNLLPGSYNLFDARYLLNGFTKRLIGRQAIRQFSEPSINDDEYDVVYHFRNFARSDGDYKNYLLSDADWLIKSCQKEGFNVACVGHPSMAYCPPCCTDLRHTDMRMAIGAFTAAKVVVGGSSAPMHLAQLCARPVVVWAKDSPHQQTTSLYTHRWNFFGSPAEIVSDQTFRPAKEEVLSAILKTLKTYEVIS